MNSRQFQVGDVVKHMARPEWGVGHVLRAEPSEHEGQVCQRLVVRFDRAGTKSLSTAFADLRPTTGRLPVRWNDPEDADALAGSVGTKVVSAAIASNGARRAVLSRAGGRDNAELSAASSSASAADSGGSRADAREELRGDVLIERKISAEQLAALPEQATDPFSTLRRRLEFTAGLYRFTGEGASLLDWAGMQTQLADPLSSFSRHELEQHFKRFKQGLDAHLRKLVREVKKQEPASLAPAFAAAPPPAKVLMRRFTIEA
ncbi:MAG: DUF3553 domain-containing protein [Planctomycetota bacterium]|nr:DUF3553 domain-containing protein [Planctomycetota bacterium]